MKDNLSLIVDARWPSLRQRSPQLPRRENGKHERTHQANPCLLEMNPRPPIEIVVLPYPPKREGAFVRDGDEEHDGAGEPDDEDDRSSPQRRRLQRLSGQDYKAGCKGQSPGDGMQDCRVVDHGDGRFDRTGGEIELGIASFDAELDRLAGIERLQRSHEAFVVDGRAVDVQHDVIDLKPGVGCRAVFIDRMNSWRADVEADSVRAPEGAVLVKHRYQPGSRDGETGEDLEDGFA